MKYQFPSYRLINDTYGAYFKQSQLGAKEITRNAAWNERRNVKIYYDVVQIAMVCTPFTTLVAILEFFATRFL